MKRWNLACYASLAALALTATLAGGCKEGSKDGGDGGAAPNVSAERKDLRLPGVDTTSLTPYERKTWATWASEFLSPCADVPVPIAQCVQEKRECANCAPAAKYLVRLVKEAKTRGQAESMLSLRFNPPKIAIDGSPTQGPDNAPVTLMEFADFECPGCAAFAPMLEKTVAEFKDKVRFVYKFVVLPAHKKAEPAARAAIAAMNQGKFWEMHHRLFEITLKMEGHPAFEQSDLESYARELKLDNTQFVNDMKSQATTDRLEKDKKAFAEVSGEAGHTPTLLINGREWDPKDGELPARIQEELADAGAPKPAPAPAPAPAGADAAAPAKTPADAGRAHDGRK